MRAIVNRATFLSSRSGDPGILPDLKPLENEKPVKKGNPSTGYRFSDTVTLGSYDNSSVKVNYDKKANLHYYKTPDGTTVYGHANGDVTVKAPIYTYKDNKDVIQDKVTELKVLERRLASEGKHGLASAVFSCETEKDKAITMMALKKMGYDSKVQSMDQRNSANFNTFVYSPKSSVTVNAYDTVAKERWEKNLNKPLPNSDEETQEFIKRVKASHKKK